MTKMDELVTAVKKAEAKAKDEKCCKTLSTVLTIIGVLVVVAAVAFAVYKFITRCKENECDCDCECEDIFEDEESCIELEFVCPAEGEVVSAEAEEAAVEEKTEE